MNELQQFIKSKPFGFVTEAELPHIIKLDRLFPLLVRCGNGRFTAPAQDLAHFIQAITAAGDYVRDVSFPVGSIERAASWRARIVYTCGHEYEIGSGKMEYMHIPCAACQIKKWEKEGGRLQPQKRVEVSDRCMFNEGDCGGVWDGFQVTSDADPGL